MTNHQQVSRSIPAGPACAVNPPDKQGQPADEQSLEQLMIRYQQADHEALRLLVSRTSPMLLRVFQGPSVTRHYAEDLLQEFWLRVHKARHSYRPDGPLLPWLLAIARYTRVDMYRRLQRDRATPARQIEELPDRQSDPAVMRFGIDFRTLVGRLPMNQRDVVLMLKVNGMTLREVAREKEITVEAVKLRAHRAYTNLRSMIHATNRGGAARSGKPALVTNVVPSSAA